MKKFFLIGLVSLLLSGCAFIDMNKIFNDALDPDDNAQYISEYTMISGNYDKKGLTGPEYLKYYSKVTNCQYLSSSGNQNILVVPVLFKGDRLSSLRYDSNKILSDIEKAFNGTSEETGWESVSSFYQKSSYGKLNIEATVYNDWVTLDKSFYEMASLDLNTYADPTWYAVDYVVSYLKSIGMDLTKFDANSDGYIDGIWLIYGRDSYANITNPTQEEETVLWAYTFWENNNVGSVGNLKANVYCWGSYDFMYDSMNSNSNIKVDTHTYIHETGHMLGLDDYYDYDDTSNPAGCLDMMDFNIGDHNAFSKYLLGWIEPKVFNFKGGEFTLKPFESSGEFILIPSRKDTNLSPLDEYLLIEYYTPTGLNELDSTYSYLGSYPKMFTKNGVKIYHVDARLGSLVYQQSDWYYDQYIRNFSLQDLYINTKSDQYFSIFASNTPSYSVSEGNKLLRLISAYRGNKYMYSNAYAQNRDLYITNSALKGFDFNSGAKFDYTIEISEISDQGVRLYID